MNETAQAVAAAHRDHWASVLAATVGLTRDLSLAEDAVQEAFAQALTAWERGGIPTSPGGWLATTARRRAVDAIRRDSDLRRKLPLLIWDEEASTDVAHRDHERIADEDVPVVRDEQLRLIFLAAHPALSPAARVALTLRLVGGLSTAQIAAAFLVPEATMAARQTRAKKRIALSRTPCRVPAAQDINERLVDVLDVVSVLLAAGQRPLDEGPKKAGSDRRVLDVAQHILEVLAETFPEHTEIRGLLAQALLLVARSGTRRDDHGRPLALADQDRSLWDRPLIDRADSLVRDALASGGRGPYLIQGAIAAAVAYPERYESIDWPEVIELYDALLRHWPTAMVRLGRAVAVAEAEGPQAGLDQMDDLTEQLRNHRQFHVIHGDLLTRVGDHEAANVEFRLALQCPGDDGEADVLGERAREVGRPNR